jgi:hypothetical protein
MSSVHDKARKIARDAIAASCERVEKAQAARPELRVRREAIGDRMENAKRKIVAALQQMDMWKVMEAEREKRTYSLAPVILIECWSLEALEKMAESKLGPPKFAVLNGSALLRKNAEYGPNSYNFCPPLMKAIAKAPRSATFVFFRIIERNGFGTDMRKIKGLADDDITLINTSFHKLQYNHMCAHCQVTENKRQNPPFVNCFAPCSLRYCSLLCRVEHMTTGGHREVCACKSLGPCDFFGPEGARALFKRGAWGFARPSDALTCPSISSFK